jgi:DNA replication and repair protein RecF
MKLNSIEISHFRNLENTSIHLGQGVNLFYGQNGSGKTSFLEAIFYLGFGRSFRSRHITRIIQHGAPSFSIFCQLSQNNQIFLPVGLERKRDCPSYNLRIGGKPATSLVEVAKILPIQLINADSHLLLTAGPLTRRQFLDWGVFHVEPRFYLLWQRANRIIKQRNASLKSARTYQDLAAWDEELVACSAQLDACRRNYINQLTPILKPMLNLLLEREDYSIHYSPGWSEKHPLEKSYIDNFERDRQFGYTQHGPHRADLQLKVKNYPAQDVLSQGQQKLAAYALRLAQGKLLHTQMGLDCLYLIDDLPSELDPSKRLLVSTIIKDINAQALITGIEPEIFAQLFPSDTKTFHVEHGQVAPIKIRS